MVLGRLAEQAVQAGGGVGHHVAPEGATGVGEAAVAGAEQDARGLEGGEDDDPGLHHLPPAAGIDGLDAGGAVAARGGEPAGDAVVVPDLGPGPPRPGQVHGQRVGEGPDGASRIAPAVVEAGQAAGVRHGVEAIGNGEVRSPSLAKPRAMSRPWANTASGGIG